MVPTVAIITTMADGMTTLDTIDTGQFVGIISMGAHRFLSPLAIDMVPVVGITTMEEFGVCTRGTTTLEVGKTISTFL
jgi:hypothetical protein